MLPSSSNLSSHQSLTRASGWIRRQETGYGYGGRAFCSYFTRASKTVGVEHHLSLDPVALAFLAKPSANCNDPLLNAPASPSSICPSHTVDQPVP